ncbi:hypothetical protein FB567DRAFT_521101 [Paraphoma chrysanthemicola]|uniref:Uncharacterized protein n=1 Tax=Paraphoma chrysanthemicola TaxID=798071 RepID=A0A8K0W0R3_9PLEO|nr:hypothetical protein FB567DRAFT_521101 [Paraphoma chrysanthemicola]
MVDYVRCPSESDDLLLYSDRDCGQNAQSFCYSYDNTEESSPMSHPLLSPSDFRHDDNNGDLSQQTSDQYRFHRLDRPQSENEARSERSGQTLERHSRRDPGYIVPSASRNLSWKFSTRRIGTSALCSLIAIKSAHEAARQNSMWGCKDDTGLWEIPWYSASVSQVSATDSTQAILPAILFTAATTGLYHNQSCDVHQDRYLLGGMVTGVVAGLALERDLEHAMLYILPWAVLLSLLSSMIAHRIVHRRSRQTMPECYTQQQTCQEKAGLIDVGCAE